MKKIICLLISVVLLFSSVPVAFAAGNDSEVIFQGEEITDLNELLQRAVLGISDQADRTKIVSKAIIKDKNGKSLPVDIISTSQLLKIEKSKNNDYAYSYATTIFTDAKLEEDVSSSSFSIMDTKSKSLWDEETGGVRAYSTLYHTTFLSGGYTYYDMYKVTGGWQVLSGYAITNKKVVIQQHGYTPTGFTTSQNTTQYPATMTFSYTLPSSWLGIRAGRVGSNQYCKITRSTSTWDFWMENFLLTDF